MADSDKKTDDQQVVFMVGASHDAQDGDRRTVSTKLAASLVARGLARYPKNKA